ncbi:MAG: hypothetical protein HFI13_02780 [Lachnospiraceae bacterium]|nr:hypothetical protein [Lachnospiraceae bacterium]
MRTYRGQRLIWLFFALLCLGGCLLCIRVHLGLDFSDETHYLALAKRFSQGDRPFREEWFPAQIVGILLLPFYHTYIKTAGGIEGILLTARIIFVLFHTAAALLVFWSLSRKEQMEIVPAFLFSFMFLFYARANIHSFSYYNIGLITFLLYLILKRTEHRLAQAGSGILFAVSVLCMPYLVLYFLVMEIRKIIRCVKEKNYWKKEAAFLAGIAVSAGIFLWFCLSSGDAGEIFRNLPEILKDPEHQGTMAESVISFGVFMVKVFYKYLFWPMAFESAGIVYYIWKGRRGEQLKRFLKAAAYVLFFLQAVYLRTFFEGGVLIAFFLLAVQVSALEQIHERELWYGYGLPGLFYGIIWMLGSNVGQRVFNMGCLISCIWAVSIIWRDCQTSQKAWTKMWKLSAAGWTLLVLIVISFFDIYRDSSVEHLTVRIESGAAKGIYTSAGRAEEYEQVLKGLYAYAGEGKILAAEGVNPWLYLEADAECGAQAVWRLDFADERNAVYYERYPEKVPDVIFLLDPSCKTYEGWRFSSHGSYTGGAEKPELEGYLLELAERENYSRVEEKYGVYYIKK